MEQITIEGFRDIAPGKLQLLEKKGFRRAQELKETGTTMATLVYRGDYVGFVFSLDVRDQCVDLEVVSMKEGRMVRSCEGGYSSDVYMHLVKYEGYRGGSGGIAENGLTHTANSKLKQEVNGWLNLLVTAGEKLLRDGPDSLPSR